MSIEWEKVLSKPTKTYKVDGQQLLDFRTKIESLERKISESNKTNDDLSTKIKTLEKEITSLNSDIKEKTEKISSLEGNISQSQDSLSNKETELSNVSSELNARSAEISKLNADISQLNTEISDLKAQISGLNEQISTKELNIENLKKEMAEKSSSDTDTISNLKTQIEDKQHQLSSKEATISEKDGQIINLNNDITGLNSKIDELNAKIEELKEQIPKKPVYEKPDETIKGPGCPKCGWTTLEEYKYIDGKQHLIRKYCPNTFCNWSWTSGEEAKISITVSDTEPEEEAEVLKWFKVNKDKLEEVAKLDSSIVAIISDPAQNTVWIWKGNESSRFEYAEATGLAAKVKNDITHKPNAQIVRVNEGAEPENFPKI